jgi:hypothetical protein
MSAAHGITTANTLDVVDDPSGRHSANMCIIPPPPPLFVHGSLV